MNGPGRQQLTLEARAKGFKQAAAEANELRDAVRGVGSAAGGKDSIDWGLLGTGKSSKAVEATEELAKAQEEANLGQQQFLDILAGASPLLAEWAGRLMKAIEATGKLAGHNFTLAEGFESLTGFVMKSAGALKFLTSVGLLFAAGMRVLSVVKEEREEFDRYADAIERASNALTKMKQGEASLQQEMESRSDKRREGGFTDAEARRAVSRFQGVATELPPEMEEAIKRAIVLGGKDLEGDALKRAAIALHTFQEAGSIDPMQPARERALRIEAILKAHAEQIEEIFARETSQWKGVVDAAKGEQAMIGGALADLITLIQRLSPGDNVDAAAIAKIMQIIEEAYPAAEERYRLRLTDPKSNRDALLLEEVRDALREQGLTFRDAKTGEERDPTLAEIEKALQVQRHIDAQEKAAADRAKREAEQKPQNVTIIHNEHNTKNYGPDAASKQRRRNNGENRARKMEAMY